jgi:hypothetical protein
MAAKSLLTALGSDVKKVFSWLGSKNGQTVIQTGEAIVETIYPPATGIINIANKWLAEIVKTEALAAGAGAQSGTGVQKSAIVIQAVTPEILAFAEQNKLPTPTADQIQTASNALVAFLNALDAKQ